MTKKKGLDIGTEVIGNSNAFNVDVKEGWSRLNVDYSTGEFTGVTHISLPTDLPEVKTNSTNNYYRLTRVYSPAFDENRSFKENIISNNRYFDTDNALGLWGYFNGEWKKIENNLEYQYEVESYK